MTLSKSEVEYGVVNIEAKAALAVIGVLKFLQTHASGRTIGMYEDNEGENALAETSYGY